VTNPSSLARHGTIAGTQVRSARCSRPESSGGYSLDPRFRCILSAPESLRDDLIELIRAEARAGDGHVVIKVNNLSDPAVIDALYEASAAGARVDLIVRSICCLRPGVAGLSENVRVRSILGQYLEHSRIFRFGSPGRGFRYLLGSADLMPRNLDRRVEVVAPVEDPRLQARIEEILELLLADDALAWELDDQRWSKVPLARGLDCQVELQDRAAHRGRAD
jgi:polyphosphate kinase